MFLRGNSGATDDFAIADHSNNVSLVVKSGGNVGIGTTSPSALLSVGSTSQFQVNSSGVMSAAYGSTAANSGGTQQAICLADGTGGGVCPASAAQTTVNCSTSGTAIFTEPFTGTSFKKVAIYSNACLGTASYTFPVAFSYIPDASGGLPNFPAGATVSSTAVTIVTTAAVSGWGFLQGF